MLAVGLSHALTAVGFNTPAALQIAVKIPLIMADLVTAVALSEISNTLAPKLRRFVLIAWLLSPAVIWVSAGDAQIETVTAASISLALCFAIRNRHLLSGIAIGVGIGFEYLPAIVVLYYLCRLTSKNTLDRLPIVSVFRMCIGLFIGLAISFVPNMLTTVGRESLVQALISGKGAIVGHGQIDFGSVWAILRHNTLTRALRRYWLIVAFVVTAVVVRTVHKRSVTTNPHASSIQTVGLVTALVIVIEPTYLPQFAVITLVSLLLVAITWNDRKMAVIACGLTIMPIIAWGLSSPIAYFFEDIDPRIFSQSIPTITTAYTSLNTAWSTAMLDITGYMTAILAILVILPKSKTDKILYVLWRISSPIVIILGAACVSLFAIWGVGGTIMFQYFGRQPMSLFDTPYNTTTRNATKIAVDGKAIQLSFGNLQIAAMAQANPSPRVRLEYIPYLVTSTRVGSSLDGNLQLPSPARVICNRLPAHVPSRVGIWLLLDRKTWTANGYRNTNQLSSIMISGRIVDPIKLVHVIGNWRFAQYVVPVDKPTNGACQSELRRIQLQPGTTSNASIQGVPWFRMWTEKSYTKVEWKGRTYTEPYTAPSPGIGNLQLPGEPQVVAQFIIPGMNEISDHFIGANLHWNDGVSKLYRYPSVMVVTGGISYGILAIVGAVFIIRRLMRGGN